MMNNRTVMISQCGFCPHKAVLAHTKQPPNQIIFNSTTDNSTFQGWIPARMRSCLVKFLPCWSFWPVPTFGKRTNKSSFELIIKIKMSSIIIKNHITCCRIFCRKRTSMYASFPTQYVTICPARFGISKLKLSWPVTLTGKPPTVISHPLSWRTLPSTD